MGRGNNRHDSRSRSPRGGGSEDTTSNFERSFGRGFGGGGGFRSDFVQREMHKAVCADCKKECDVPFKPIEGKPVYCRECYPKHRKF